MHNTLVPAFGAFINTIPDEIIGGISFVLYGMISAVGLRTLVDNKVDFSNQRNVIIAGIILVVGLAFNVNPFVLNVANVSISFSGLACAAIVGIFLNAILPNKDYKYEEN